MQLSRIPEARTALLVILLIQGALPLRAQSPGDPVELTRAEQEGFLLNARIDELQAVGVGVTDSRRATLSDGRLTHDAHVQTVDIYMQKFTAGDKSEMNFRDFWGFNIAAYRLDKLLDLQMVPVSVERLVEGEKASVTWWVDRVLMGMAEYQEGERKPPNLTHFDDQRRLAAAFHQLVLNRDPNLGNSLIDEDWKLWIFDFTRAFRQWKKLDDVKILTRIDRKFYENLRDLDLAAVEREIGPYLRGSELKGLFARRVKLLEHYDKKIKKHGEAVVLIDLSDG